MANYSFSLVGSRPSVTLADGRILGLTTDTLVSSNTSDKVVIDTRLYNIMAPFGEIEVNGVVPTSTADAVNKINTFIASNNNITSVESILHRISREGLPFSKQLTSYTATGTPSGTISTTTLDTMVPAGYTIYVTGIKLWANKNVLVRVQFKDPHGTAPSGVSGASITDSWTPIPKNTIIDIPYNGLLTSTRVDIVYNEDLEYIPNTPYTTTSASFIQPTIGSTVSVSVLSTSWLTVNQTVYITGGGYYTVSSITNTTSVVLTNIGSTGNATATTSITSGNTVSNNASDFPLLKLRGTLLGYEVAHNRDFYTPKSVLLVGTSISRGTGATQGQSGLQSTYSQKLLRSLKTKYQKIRLINKSVSGGSTTNVVQAMNWDFYDVDDVSLIIFEHGTNDVGQGNSYATFSNNISNFVAYKQAKYPNAIMLILAPLPSGISGTESTLATWRSNLVSLVSGYNDNKIIYVPESGTLFNPVVEVSGTYVNTVDGIHLNPAGNTLLYNVINTVINNLTLI